jgi:sortase A
MRVERLRRGRCLELILLGAAVVCLAWWGVGSLQAARYQSEGRAALARARAAAAAPAGTRSGPLAGAAIGSLEIPRLGLSAIIAEGDDPATLKVAVGHLPDTPLPWRDGNSALAGHRDTFFRPLQHIQVGDELRVSAPEGDFRYEVRQTMVVGPGDLWVLDPAERPTLTLITCYPFRYVGKAPRRFIVRAERVSPLEPAADVAMNRPAEKPKS